MLVSHSWKFLSWLSTYGYNFIEPLLAFRTYIAKLAVEVENKLKCPAPNRSPGRSQRQPPESAWFTPPFNDNVISRIPYMKPLIVLKRTLSPLNFQLKL